MKSLSLSTAKTIVGKPTGRKITNKEFGITTDIITQIHSVFNKNFRQVGNLAQALSEGLTETTLRNIYGFVQTNIRYILDKPGTQDIKTPSRILYDGFADCKGLSILLNSLLASLNIKCGFRYASYQAGGNFTHVYSIAVLNGKTYVLDACMPAFNQEKPTITHKDNFMQINTLSGLGEIGEIEVPFTEITGTESEGELDMKLHRESRALEAQIVSGIQGPGSPLHEALSEAVADYDRALGYIRFPDQMAGFADGIGRSNFFKRAGNTIKKAARKVTGTKASRAARRARRSKLIKKVASGVKKGVKKGLKAIKKVITAPQRLLLKQVLPKAGPAFIYLFITNAKTVAALPSKIQRKRRRQINFMRFLCKITDLSESQFLSICRNGIMRKYRATPEQVLMTRVKGPINGIGAEGGAGADGGKSFPPIDPSIIINLITKVISLFGKKPSEEETPEGADLDADFEEVTPTGKRMVYADAKYRSAAQAGEEPDSYENEVAQRAEQDQVLDDVQNEPEGTDPNAPLPGEETETENFNKPGSDLESQRPGGSLRANSTASGSGLNPLLLVLPLTFLLLK